MAESRSQRTEKPTGKRLQEERDKGNVPRTKELPGALSLIAMLVFGHLFGGDWMRELVALVRNSLAGLHRPELTTPELLAFFAGLGGATASLLLLPLGFMVVAGVGGNLVQGAPPFTLKPLQPDLSKLNPLKGIKKVVRLKSWVEMLKTALKMALFTVIAITAVREAMLMGLPGSVGAAGTAVALFALAGKVVFRVAMFALALAILDFLYSRWDHTRQLMMTKQQVKDERKESEGDPMVKARVRSKQMSLARSRMMADVAKATVVVTNPTHYAIALRYVPGEMDLPQVLAKGRGKLAGKIREVARHHGVPIISDPPLARALYRMVQVGGTIPEKLFRAVAEVLALVLRGRGRRPTPGNEVRP